MFQPAVSISQPATALTREATAQRPRLFGDAQDADRGGLLEGVRRRWRRERRRRKVGRAYDMALEIARFIPINSRILDVGCGNGFIAHHLASFVGANPIGIDLGPTTESAIEYRRYDGDHFPLANGAVDAALLCYVLHHAQDFGAIMSELRRVLSNGGVAIVYEDIPRAWWDRAVCWTHDLKWRGRTGPCTFRNESEWRDKFKQAGFEVIREKQLSRWRNFAHPVSRMLYVLKRKP